MRATCCWLAFGALALTNGSIPLTSTAQDWWIEAGPVFRGGMKVSVEGSSYVQGLGLHSPAATGPLSSPTGIGAPNGYADRVYDNGYVKLDPGTGNTDSVGGPNATWNWGFANPAQYNAVAQTLSFQKQGDLGYTTLANGTAEGSDKLLGAGLHLMAGLPLTKSGRWSLDLALGFQGIWGAHSDMETTTYGEDVRQVTVTDIYNVSGIPPAQFPAQGFQGTYLGPFDNPPVIPSPVIPNLPSERLASTSAAFYTAQNRIGFDVDQSLYQFSLGPKIAYEVSQRVKLNVRPSVSLNLINARVNRTETFAQSSAGGGSVVLQGWSNEADEWQALFGLGATAGADVDLGKGFYAGVFGGYEWVAEQAKVSIGPNTVSFDAGGWVGGAVIGKRF